MSIIHNYVTAVHDHRSNLVGLVHHDGPDQHVLTAFGPGEARRIAAEIIAHAHAIDPQEANVSHTASGWKLHPNHVTQPNTGAPFNRNSWIDSVTRTYPGLTRSQVRKVVTLVELEHGADDANPLDHHVLTILAQEA